MKRTALILMIITITMKILGFFREIVLSYFYGASYISDAYLISLTIPGAIFSFIGSGIIASFIPIYNQIEKDEGLNSAESFTSNVINNVMLLSMVIIISIFLFADIFVKIFASGFEGKVFELAVLFTRITSIEIIFISIIYIFTGYLNNKNKFLVPVLTSLPFNFAVILSIILSKRMGLYVLPIGSVIAYILQFIFLLIFMRKQSFKYNGIIDIKNNNLRKMIKLSIPVIIGVSVNQINILVDRTIASQIVMGGISALNYSSRLNGFVEGIFISSVVTILYPRISRLASEDNIDEFKKIIASAIRIVSIFVIPITVGCIFFSKQIVLFLFGRGAFDQTAVELTSITLLFYSIGLIGFGFREIISRGFYALQDTRTPMINATIGVVLNIILNLILSYFFGLGGLALATSLSSISIAILMFFSLRKRLGTFGIKKILITFFKIGIASILMGIIAIISYNYLTTIISLNLALLMAIIIGAVSYFIMICFMKIDDVDEIIREIKVRFGKKA